MANVTYLLGAGASANSLPVIQNFNERLIIVSKILKDITSLNQKEKIRTVNTERIKTKKQVINDLEWLIESASSHQTIDTLAKKFYHKNHGDLVRLKRILIFFFQFEQKLGPLIREYIEVESVFNDNRIKENFDKRYDSFIAAILKNNPTGISLLDNVKVLSWNYDCQFEIALQKYTAYSIRETKINYQIFPNAGSFTFNNPLFDKGKFGFIKLNGSAEYDPFLFYQDSQKKHFLESEEEDEVELIDILLDFYSKSVEMENTQNSHITYFNYSWEIVGEFTNKYAGYMSNIQNAYSIAETTDILVVIGYSFPFFNREIDRQIMNSKSIGKVYVQDLDPTSRIFTIQESFSNLRNKKIQPINFTNSFFLPPEL